MPTTNPRVNVTLPPALDALVQRLAIHQRTSKSHIVRELLETAEPALQRVVALMDAAASVTGALKTSLGASLHAATDQAEEKMADTLRAMDAATQDIVNEAQRIKGRRRAAGAEPSTPAGAALDPPPSNRGVKSFKKGGQHAL